MRSKPEGDGLVSNAEVLAWLKEKNFEMSRKDVPDGVIKTPSSTANVARDVREYIESSPAGKLNQFFYQDSFSLFCCL